MNTRAEAERVMCECLKRPDGTWHVDECCAHVMDTYHDPNPEHKYSMDIRWSDEDDGFIAICPEFGRGISAFGTTQAKAAEELTIAVVLAIEVAREHGVLPEPRRLEGK